MLDKVLKKYWGFNSFRPLQREIINSIINGKDTLGILPTGGGKSLTFQVPGLIIDGVVIVVTPLISLIKDQVDNLRAKHIQAVYFHSGMSVKDTRIARERLFNNKAKFLYISPERLSNANFLNDIRSLKVKLIVVDEAHCISQWGYDFRPSYLKINVLRKIFPDAVMLALTASATETVANDICKQLHFQADHSIFRGSIYRKNLSYLVKRSDAKLSDILNILKKTEGSGIVYVRSRKKTKEIAEFLSNSGISATFYHAGLENIEKNEKQNNWMLGVVRVMVATNAFGMGIDKPDVRVVVHYDMPPSIEEYYQEAGRAGRDGKDSKAVLLISNADKTILRRRLTMEFPEKDIIKKIYTRLCIFSNLAIGEGYDKVVEFDINRFCNTYGLREAVVRPALRILRQANYVEFIEEFENSSRLKVIIDRDELYKTKINSEVNESILTSIMRNFPGLFADYVFISEKKVSYLTGYDESVIYEKLLELAKMKIISYIPKRKTPILYFPTSMEEEKYVQIGKAVYEDRKEILNKRIESIIDYAFNENQCRLRKLKIYFSENSENEFCDCDICRSKRTKNIKESSSEISYNLRKIFIDNGNTISDEHVRNILGNSYSSALLILRAMVENGSMTNENGKWKLLK